MIKKSFSALFILLFIFSGCSRKPILYTSDEVMEEFYPTYLDFDYLSARGRIVIEEANGKTTRGTINIRAKKDSIFWFSVTPGLGLEAFRGVVTRDHLRVKDRLNGEDINMSFGEIQDRYDLKLTLELVQNLIYANIPHQYSYRDRLMRVGRYFELSQSRDGIRYHSRVATTHGKVEELTSTTEKEKGGLTASYPTFEDVEGQPFPNKMLLRFSYDSPDGVQVAIVNLEMTRIEFPQSSLNFPFQF
jgi:hypothetical protein